MADDWTDLPGIEDVTAVDAVAEVQRLAKLPILEYESVRKDAAARLGWRATILDSEVQKIRPRDPRGATDDQKANSIETLEPWPDPVDGASLAEEVRSVLTDYVVFGAAGDPDAATLWVFGSYLMDTWRLWPKLLISSPTKACGKSTLLEVIEAVAHRGMIVSNSKSAGIFRAIEAWKPTLCLDEADTWMREDQELAGILNSGHTRRTANVLRVQERDGELVPMNFSTWCPMVIAGIGSQRDTLESRSVMIGLRRKLPDETVKRLPFDLHEHMTRVRRQLVRWTADHALTLGAMTAEPPECGNDRRRDNYTPLWRIAAVLGDVWPDRIAAAYAAQAHVNDDDNEPAGVMLLRDLQAMFAIRNTDRIATSEILGELLTLEDRPWLEWRHGKPATAQTVAKLLKPFDVRVKVLKVGSTAARVYLRMDVKAAFDRYAAMTGVQKCNPVTLQVNQEVTDNSRCNLNSKVTLPKDANQLKTNDGYGVTPLRGVSSDMDDPSNPDVWA